MGKNSGIQWTHHTFNPWWGCTRVSPGCERCYAETFAHRLSLKVWGREAERRFFGDKHWREPMKWNADAEKRGVRERVFCASMADVFEDRRDLDHQRARLWMLIAETPHLDWQLLTKRPENMVRLAPKHWEGRWPRNVWAGCTVEDGTRASRRLPHLLQVPAKVRFISCEPLIERVNLTAWVGRLDWVIIGGESGSGARPFHIEWALDIIRACSMARTPAFMKQLGANAFYMGEDYMTLDGHGGDDAEWPPEIRVRDFPVRP